MYQSDDLLPSNRNYVLLIGCFTLIFTLVIFIFLGSYFQKPAVKEKIAFTPESTLPQADLTRYQQDSDNDLIPNFIEDEAILNTYIAESSYCEQSNPLCSGDPLQDTHFISVIVDSSTSMNIPAKENLSKIDLVKRDLISYLDSSLKKNFLKLQIVGFGNKGSVSFIADNESCVSNFNFKNFDQVLKGEETNPLVLKNLYANGKSPIEFSLLQAEKNFPNKNGKNLVIIITDGIDDCGANLTTSFKQVLDRGIIKKINLISLYAPQDENQKLREATESNGGKFTNSDKVFETINGWEKDFIFTNWCKYQGQNKIYQCIDKNYNKAFATLDQQINSKTPKNEVDKVREIKSSSDLLIQNYKNSKTSILSQEFEKIFNQYFKNY